MDAFEKDNEEKIRNINLEKQAINNVLKRTQTDLKVGDKARKHVLGLVEKGTAVRWSEEVFKVVSIQGQTITLDDQSRHKRKHLLHVPDDAKDFIDNPIMLARREIISTRQRARYANKKPEQIKSKMKVNKQSNEAEQIAGSKMKARNPEMIRAKFKALAKKKAAEAKAAGSKELQKVNRLGLFNPSMGLKSSSELASYKQSVAERAKKKLEEAKLKKIEEEKKKREKMIEKMKDIEKKKKIAEEEKKSKVRLQMIMRRK